MARETATGFPWLKSGLLVLPAIAFAFGGGMLDVTSPLGLGMIAAGIAYLCMHLFVVQPRIEASARTDVDPERAAQRFLQRALEADDIKEVSAEFEEAVVAALGPTRAVLIAPNPDGGVRVLSGAREEPADQLGDAVAAFLWLGEGVQPVLRSELEASTREGTEDVKRLMDRLGADVLLPLRHRGLLLGLALIGAPQRPQVGRLDAFHRAMRAFTTVAVANTFLDAEARDRKQLTQTFDLATVMQEALMPSERPVRRDGFSLRGVFRPMAECGGDLWAWYELSEDRVLLLVADATGHGAAPALLAAVAKGTIDAQWQLWGADLDPGRLLSALNRAVFHSGRRRYLMTAVAVVIDVTTKRCTFANAGQNFPYLITERGLEQLVARGDQLGVQPEVQYEVHSRNLENGDRLILYTDGFIEAATANGEPFGEKRFRASLAAQRAQPAVRIPDLLVQRVAEHVEGQSPGDDMTCIAFELGEGER
ncbi:MAG TPA: PP2C family protein-serine/threonine phosphatase [Kofleriaceae bacterium]|nr:PP2C family protein-serine/threonine phosphatase [Kofleriaceae bacterium]